MTHPLQTHIPIPLLVPHLPLPLLLWTYLASLTPQCPAMVGALAMYPLNPQNPLTTSLKSFRLLTAVHLGTHSVTNPASMPQPILTPQISDTMVNTLQCLHMQHLGKGCMQCWQQILFSLATCPH